MRPSSKGTMNPFDDVVLLERPADGAALGVPAELTLMDKFNKWMNPYGTAPPKKD